MDIDHERSYEECKKATKNKSMKDKMAFGLQRYDPTNLKVFDK